MAPQTGATAKRALLQEDVAYVNANVYGAGLTATTLNAAVAALGTSTKTTLFLATGVWNLASDVTVPLNITLWIPSGTTVTINGGITFTVHGPILVDADNATWHSGAGTFVWDYHGLMPRALTLINVQDYGANPDDAGDDTAAIQAAIATIPGTDSAGAYYTTKGAGCLYFPLPRTVGGFYKLSSTLDFTEKWNVCLIAPGPYSRSRAVTDPDRKALFKWYGAANQNVLLFHNVQSAHLENISVDCRNVAGTRGLAFGADGAAASSVKFISVDGLDIGFCDIGLRYGDNANGGPDIASNEFDHVFLHDNVTQGIGMYSANGLLNVRDLLVSDNGHSPAGGKQGANVYAEGGQVVLFDYVSASAIATVPALADIVCHSAGLQIYGGWVDTVGPVINCDGPSSQASVVSGLRHYNGSMTDANTPNSIIWASDNTLTIDGYLFSNVQVNSGNSSLVIDRGVRFHTGAPHTTVTPAFTGTAIANQHAYIGMATGTAHGRIALGKPPRTDIGPQSVLEMTGFDRQPLLVPCIDDAGDGCGTLGYQAVLGGWNFFGNAYFDGTNIKSIASGPMTWLRSQGGTAAQITTELRVDTATGAGQTKFAPGTVVWGITYFADGATTNPILTMGANTLHWSSAAPTLGTWAQGDITINSSATVGQPKGWRCTVGGTPGTWVSEGNL